MTDDPVRPWIQMSGQPPTNLPDDGPALLEKIRTDLQMDDEWIVRTERTLTWWGEPIPITITVAEPRLVDGDATVKLTAAATVLVDVKAPTETVLAVLNDVNRIASVGAFVYDEHEHRVDAYLTHYAYAGIEPITHMISALALLMYGEAAGRSRSMAESLSGTANVVPHPASGVREGYDEMMTFTETQVVPAGAHASRWFGGELEHLAAYLTENDLGTSTGSDEGLTVEFPLARNNVQAYVRLRSHHAADVNFDEEPLSPFFAMPTALGQMLCVTHPVYGSGLLSILRFPVRTSGAALAFANDFNLGEYQGLTAVPALGAWCADDDGLVHNSFVPNYYRQDWVAPNLAFWAGARTQWAFEAMAPDEISRREDAEWAH